MTYLLLAVGGLVFGSVAGYAIRAALVRRKIASAEAQAEKTLNEARLKSEHLVLEAKEKALAAIEEAKREEQTRRGEWNERERRMEKREAQFDQKVAEVESRQKKLETRTVELDGEQRKLDELRASAIKRLEEITGLSRDAAREELLKLVEVDSREAFANRLRKLEQEGAEALESRAKNIVSLAIQRSAASHSVETTTTTVDLPSDEMKGRIIGKEGRNIKAIEHLTGTEIVVDETPNAIMVSGFSPIRRQIAKRALAALIKDGRIHPGRIEEAVEEAKKELAVDIKKAGEDALFELGISTAGLDPKVIQILGRLKYRTSYGQNVLLHSIEVGRIAGLMAEEIGADVANCKKGGLFHDLGKAVDHDVQGSHPTIGYNLMLKFGLPEEIAYHSIGHHEDKPRTLEAVIVKSADAISGARPGARKDTLEQYVHRLEELEKAATAFTGVDKAYAIQAGRELRVFVSPKEIDDFAAYRLASDVAKKIESELQYPGEVRVVVIRETRVIEYAR